MNRTLLHLSNFSAVVLLGLCLSATAAKADTVTGVFSNYIYAGNLLNFPALGQTYYQDNTGMTVTGTATPGGSLCAGANTLCWGTAPDLNLPANQQYSSLIFTGSTTFNENSSATQTIGTIAYQNGTSDTNTLIFGATLSFYDGTDFLGSDSVIISTTSNQYSGTGLTPSQLAIDADYINICGNDSNICGQSIEAYEAGEGGTGLLVDLSGHLVGDPTFIATNAALDPSQANCTTCGVVGSEAAQTVVPEPPALLLVASGLLCCAGLVYRRKLQPGFQL